MTGVFDDLAAERGRLQRTSAAHQVAELLREHITAGALSPGTQLPEEALGTALGVSRNTLRESFRLLADQRLVVHEMNRGVFVRVLSADDVADIYVLRRALETAGIRAASVAPPERLAVLRVAVERGEAARVAADWVAVGTADLDFHLGIAALTGSERISEAMGRLLAELRLAFGAMPSAAELHEPFLRRNRTLAELLATGRIAEAEAELASYLDDACRGIVAAIRGDLEVTEC
ncbi:GntR family transcriptional regulator [Catenulispora yoronensis]|uniref:GntR family transcriptional regulator n=1 Tax=Catenulispora yoronensis TaxID=450799 RepID=UPI0031D50D3B